MIKSYKSSISIFTHIQDIIMSGVLSDRKREEWAKIWQCLTILKLPKVFQQTRILSISSLRC